MSVKSNMNRKQAAATKAMQDFKATGDTAAMIKATKNLAFTAAEREAFFNTK